MTARRGRALRVLAVVAVLSATGSMSLESIAGATVAAQDDQVTTSTTIGVELGDGVSVTRPAAEEPEVAGEQVSQSRGTSWWPWAITGLAVLFSAFALSRRLGWLGGA